MEAAVLRVDEYTELHPPTVEVAEPLFQLVDEPGAYLRNSAPKRPALNAGAHLLAN